MQVIRMANGRWIVAGWNSRNSQWQSSNLKDPWLGYCYSYAGTLEGLEGVGIVTYTHKRGAQAALRRIEGEP